MLSDLVELSLKGLSPERKAHIDLIILRNRAGRHALVPRAFLVKYPILLAFEKDGRELGGEEGPLHSVAPWTTHPKMADEGVALATLFLPGVTEVEFGNYQERFQAYFLKRRTDPAAMRGEKLFVQGCVGCHDSGSGPGIRELASEQHRRALASGGHPNLSWLPKLTDRDRKALVSYLEAYREESGDRAAMTGP